ncbi:hypothetical protein HMPREF1332_03143 [Enterococcus faecalis ERV31]|nr:hypothetical protein HMPREF1332_03143 [Enterococcus faecalis ERV31]
MIFGEFRLISEGVGCFRRLSVFERGTKIQSDFCPRLFFSYNT